MRLNHVIQSLSKMDRQGRCVFNLYDLRKMFPDDSEKTRHEGLQRLVRMGLLRRACRGIYVNEYARSFGSYVIEDIAKALRYGEYNYISLESMLSEYGLISQIPVDRINVMTTGAPAVIETPYGVIEFTHTKRSVDNILTSVQRVAERPLRLAKLETAIRDLKRVNRNLHLLREEKEDD